MRQTKKTSFLKAISLSAAACLSLATLSQAQIRYELRVPEVMGAQVNRASANGNKINENGEVLINRVYTFAVWKDQSVTHIVNANTDYPATLSRLSASSINRYEEVVGSKTYLVSDEAGQRYDTFPFYWDPSNGVVDLDDIGERSANGSGTTSLNCINTQGLAIGSTQVFSGEQANGNKAFTWSFETGRVDIAPLDSFESQSVTSPLGLNDNGTVVGTYRRFQSSSEIYTENGFIYDSAEGSMALAEIDPVFFPATASTARDINNHNALVGEIGSKAYIYEMDSAVGRSIASPTDPTASTRAYAINDSKVVVGNVENRGNAGHLGYAPILWTSETGTIELLSHIKRSLESLLPEGSPVEETIITPKSINQRGQISASLETDSSFSREIVLEPVLDFRWSSMKQVVENGVTGALYVHDKKKLGSTIPAAALGLSITFECSADMSHWEKIPSQSQVVRHYEDDDTIELFVPFSGCIFIRPTLEAQSAATSSN